MAIPNPALIVCPACSATERVTIADTSIGPRGRVSETPIYSLRPSPLWRQSKHDGETWLSCTTCGAKDFASLAQLARGEGPSA